jgi:hypothetical protein
VKYQGLFFFFKEKLNNALELKFVVITGKRNEQ